MTEKQTARWGKQRDGAEKTTTDIGGRPHHSTPARRPQPVFAAGRVIGHVAGDTFTTRRAASKHMLRKPPAWAVDAAALRRLADLGVQRIVIEETEGCLVYSAPLAAFFEYGFKFDHGHGQQVGLRLGYWHVQVQGVDDFERASAEVRQLTLWGEWT